MRVRNLFPLGTLLLLMWACACGGPVVSTNIVRENSVDLGVDAADLPVQSGKNVRVFSAPPEHQYMLVATRDASFDYQRLSVAYRKIEKEKLVDELRDWAGRQGANGVIVMISDTKHDVGSVGRSNLDDTVPHTVLQSDDLTREYVRAFAIYCKSSP